MAASAQGGHTTLSPPTAKNPRRALLSPRREPDRLGRFHVLQLVVLEFVLIAGLMTAGFGPVPAIGAASGGLLVMLAVLSRYQGRWWVERRAIAWRFRKRRRAQAADARAYTDPRLAVLGHLASNLAVRNVRTADGSQVGIGSDDAGWFAVAAVTSTAPMYDGPGARVPLAALTAALADVGQPGTIVQVVRHTLPAPGPDRDPTSPVGRSYRQVLTDTGFVPMDQSTWVAVRLEGRLLAEAGAPGGVELDGAPSVVAAVIRRVTKSLWRCGVPCRVLNDEELVAALARSCDLDAITAEEAGRVREEWTAWRTPRLTHRSFWVHSWPQPAKAAAVLDVLTSAPATMTNVSLVLAPEGELVDLRCLVRVGAPASVLPKLCHDLLRQARRVNAHLVPLDGEHGPAAYASAPTGGGVR